MDKKDVDLGIKAKDSLINFVEKIDERLKKYWQDELTKSFGFNKEQKDLVEKMLLHAEEHNMRPAKRIRGAFVVYGYMLGKVGEGIDALDERIWKVACGVELVHTALLMHDDFMDRDKVRRGKPTTQEYFADGDVHYGDSMAVCLGDAVLCMGFELIQSSGFEADKILLAMNQMQRGIVKTAFGQAYDAHLAKTSSLTEENVLSLHRAKTAIYTYENPLLIGAVLSELSEDMRDILRDYSRDGGISFQLQDDILGIYGEEEKTGKSVNSDLLQGKVTLMTVKTLEVAREDQKEFLMQVLGKMNASDNKINKVKQIMKESGAYDYNKRMAAEYAQKAVQVAKSLRKLYLNTEAIDFIEGVAEYMVEREV